MLVVLAGAAVAIYSQRKSFVDSLHRVGVGAMVASFAAGLVGVGCTFPVWREVLRGLGVGLGRKVAARVYFTTQLGKYVPGSVWPVVMQMEAGRSRGASRRTMLSANLITIVLSSCVGLIFACMLLPIYDAGALRRYWWALLTLPVLLALLHPRALPGLLDRLLRLVGRPPLGEHLQLGAELRAGAWSALSWIGYGTHVWILCAGLGHRGLSVFILATGGMALAIPVGVLFIPAPAGAGVRDVVLALVLSAVLGSGQPLAVVVASRVILIACDVTLAGAADLVGRWGNR